MVDANLVACCKWHTHVFSPMLARICMRQLHLACDVFGASSLQRSPGFPGPWSQLPRHLKSTAFFTSPVVFFVESQQVNERFISDPGAQIFQQKFTCEGRSKSMPSIGNMLKDLRVLHVWKFDFHWFSAKPCWTRSNHYHQSNFNVHVINACWSSVPRMRKEPGYGTSRVAVARAVLLPVAFASDLNYQGATTRAMLCRLCCCAMCCHVFICNVNQLIERLQTFIESLKAYVWDVSLPFLFLFMSACGFSLLMLIFGKRYHPPDHMLIFSVI